MTIDEGRAGPGRPMPCPGSNRVSSPQARDAGLPRKTARRATIGPADDRRCHTIRTKWPKRFFGRSPLPGGGRRLTLVRRHSLGHSKQDAPAPKRRAFEERGPRERKHRNDYRLTWPRSGPRVVAPTSYKPSRGFHANSRFSSRASVAHRWITPTIVATSGTPREGVPWSSINTPAST